MQGPLIVGAIALVGAVAVVLFVMFRNSPAAGWGAFLKDTFGGFGLGRSLKAARDDAQAFADPVQHREDLTLADLGQLAEPGDGYLDLREFAVADRQR